MMASENMEDFIAPKKLLIPHVHMHVTVLFLLAFCYCHYHMILNSALCLLLVRNACHGSDAPESGAKEIALWFKDEELVDWTHPCESWIYE